MRTNRDGIIIEKQKINISHEKGIVFEFAGTDDDAFYSM